jgi:hypothetical protein
MSSAIPKILWKKEEIDSRDSRDDDRKQTNKTNPKISLVYQKGIGFSNNSF